MTGSHGAHDFPHGDSGSGAEVVSGFQMAAGLESLSGCNLGLGEVADVDVVADAGAVGRVVIGAEYFWPFACLQCREHEEKEIAGAGVVDPGVARPNDLEVAQRRALEPAGRPWSRMSRPPISLVSPYGDSGKVGVSSVTI
ncbi:hypothetical protein GCM10023063_26540 [Arthrobacter methylotrophus]